ncbi:hypothetical protein K450DRAFT_250554 [Umbelopsis ramanniana AG]|uniref:Seipin n=1 Tax=Umbelopsis ramanniana AG TaxID=1314678 RepID=A0AAD5E6R7_UMBRA|nr:uncharacterized protein K450DRAFT_250554 [Umbelopsis ramanniana AG]KAI8577729.1 hypothetical protein K450DRAFT_250554 [Umbelopsis ramanniana AG]
MEAHLTNEELDELSALAESDQFHVVPDHIGNDTYSTTSTQDLMRRGDPDAPFTESSNAPTPFLVTIVAKVFQLLRPLFAIIFSPRVQRTVIRTAFLTIALSWIVSVACSAYIAFYMAHVPKTAHIEPVYLQYDKGMNPMALVDLTQKGTYTKPLRHEQQYRVDIHMHVPSSEINFDVGNFMVRVDLKAADDKTVAFSSRPSILRYQSALHRTLAVFARALPLLLGLAKETQTLVVPMMEHFVEDQSHSVTKAIVSVSDSRLQVYSMQLHMVADFHGLRYYMYNHRIITAMVFITLFICIELSFATVAWRLFGYTLWTRISQWADSVAKEGAGGYTEASSEKDPLIAGLESASEKSDQADDDDSH